jgi:hypothetical protein
MPEYTTDDEARFAEIRKQLRDDGLPRRETRDIAMAVQVAQTFRRARALIGTDRQIAHGIQPLPSGGD